MLEVYLLMTTYRARQVSRMTSLTAAASTVAPTPNAGGSDLFKGFSSISNRVGFFIVALQDLIPPLVNRQIA